jgi:hypothetical protein
MQKDYDEDCLLTSVAEHVILLGKNLETLYCCWMLYQTQASSTKRRNQIGNKTDPLNGLAGDESLAYKDCQII